MFNKFYDLLDNSSQMILPYLREIVSVKTKDLIKNGYCMIPYHENKVHRDQQIKIKFKPNVNNTIPNNNSRGGVIYHNSVKFSNTSFNVGVNSYIVIDKKVRILNGLAVNASDNSLCFIGKFSTIGSLNLSLNSFDLNQDREFILGAECLLSHNIAIRVSDGHPIYSSATGQIINNSKFNFVHIGNHVWIGQQVMILKDVIVPRDSVIGARSLVTSHHFESNSVICGAPAVTLKRGCYWKHGLNTLF
jgi:acetyltransferase-like isoleucine patch superfamily enzyme